jgi:isopenicillin-N epimerase
VPGTGGSQTATAVTDAAKLRELFLLDPEIAFLNHGAHGACPRSVFDEYRRWQLELERQPVAFFRRYPDLYDEARGLLARHVGADPPNVVFVPNATSGMNMALRSLELRPGDEILTTDHEYGAVDLLWQKVCAKPGARIVRRALRAGTGLVDELFAGANDRTRVLSLSHVSSPTAIILPVEEICARARDAGILTFVDGAHAPGQLDLDLEALGADVYAGNCHKWLCAPKGSGFLYARPEHHEWVEPLVLGWGLAEEDFTARHRWRGTADPAAWLATPAAIDFQAEHGWADVRRRCHALAHEASRRLAERTGLEPLAPDDGWFGQMVAAPLPPGDEQELQRRLYDEHRIEVPLFAWNDRRLLRVSFQGYNDERDLDRLLSALDALL